MLFLKSHFVTGCASAFLLLAMGIVAILEYGPSSADAEPRGEPAKKTAAPPEAEFFTATVRPFLKRHCLDCHSGAKPEGKHRLDLTRDAAAVTERRAQWTKVLKMLRTGQMPPEDEPRPPAADVERIVGWLDLTLNYVDCDAPRDPGHVTIRRLNRVEYKNTIRDLLYVDFAAGDDFTVSDDFPADEVGYGFDNIGDVLTLPPLLMEKYLAAAGRATRRAIPTRPKPFTKEFAPAGMKRRGRVVIEDGDGWFIASGELFARFDIPREGRYKIRARAYGEMAGEEPPKMQLSIDQHAVKTFDVRAVSGKPGTYEHVLQLSGSRHRIGLAYINDFYNPIDPDPNNRDRNLALVQVEIVELLDPKSDAELQSQRRLLFVRPGKEVTPRQAAEKVLRRFATRAFRRPVTDRELTRLLAVAAGARKRGSNFEESIRLAFHAALVSPHFLFKVELDPAGNEPVIRNLNDYELATRLSYFLWSTMPDEELLRQARAGTLRKNFEPQVRRMLADAKIAALAENFAAQWLGLRNLDLVQPDRQQFDRFDERLRGAMREEAVRFFDSIVHENGSLLTLIDADYTFVNERLARHYGIANVRGDHFRRVSLGNSVRGGVLTMGGVLLVTSNPMRTSPVKRGKWIMDNILGTPPADPPNGVPELDESPQAVKAATMRARLEIHRRLATCAVCHRYMDSLGFAMENFDAVGHWRNRDGRFEIDASGEFPDGKRFSGPAELKRLLVASRRDEFVRCFVEKMLTYALGRGIEYYDRCTVDDICTALGKNDYRFSTLVIEMVTSDTFRKRRGTERQP